MTGYDGEFSSSLVLPGVLMKNFHVQIDRLQFTITSRKEMDAVGFVDEIRKATNDLRALFGGDVLASKL